MFDKKWFIKHQKKLLWLLNTPLIRIWFRWVLRINGKRSSVGRNRIIKILPNAIFWKGKKKNEYVAEFRTHNKFSKRLVHAFYPIWKLIHLWDTLIANNFQPALNLGFDQLTFYPHSADGWCGGATTDPQTFNDARSLSTGNYPYGSGYRNDQGTDPAVLGDRVGNSWYVGRAFFPFDTSSLGGSAEIQSATFSVYVTDVYNADSVSTRLVQTTQASPTSLSADDFDQCGSLNNPTAGASDKAHSSISTSAYNDWSLNSTGLSWINKTGYTKLGLRVSTDYLNQTPTGSNSLNIHYSEGANDPKLVVTFLRMGGSFLFNFI